MQKNLTESTQKVEANLVNLIKWSHVKKMYHRGSTVPNAAASGCSKKTDR